MLDPGRDQPRNSFPLSDGIGNRIHRYNSWEAMNSGFWASNQVDMVESGICSPPLWTRSPQHGKNYDLSLSPESRTQAIARGQRELMEMVRHMPESSYELSLKDLVEKPSVQAGEENEIEDTNLINKNVRSREGSRGNSSSRKIDQTALVKRSGNVYSGGFYLKMMFPTSLGSKKKKKKKKNESSGNESSKVSLRPSASEGSLKDVVEKEEWWKKSPSPSVDSESGATSINSGSTKSSGSTSSSSSNTSRSNSRRERSVGSCWFLIGKPRSLTQE